MGSSLGIGFYPFWFWNGELTEDEIRRQIREMSEQGIKGFFMHSRQGLSQPYLSEEFFKMVDVAVSAAEEHGMVACLYDEYPYPSGVAGGEVILGSPQYYATRLVQRSYDVAGGRTRLQLPQGKILSVEAYPVDDGKVQFDQGVDLRRNIGMVLTEDSYVEMGLTMYNRKRYFASEPMPVLDIELPPSPHRIYISCQVEVIRNKYWNHFVDALNPDAIRRFIELTHERYKARYREKLGSTIPSIFVDEIAPDWSDRIPAAFLEKYGYDLCDHMTALQDPSHPDHKRVAHDLYNLRYEMFCESFEKPISEWCHSNGIAYCGEKPSMRLSQLRYMDIPGCDVGHTKAGAPIDLLQASIRGNAKAAASAAYFYGKDTALCECYHSLGWSGTLQDAKVMAEGLLLWGVNCLVPHGFFYTTHNLRKHDAPPSFFFQMPYWPMFGRLSERIERLGRALSGGYVDAEVLVVAPHSGIPTRRDLGEFARILAVLSQNHIDFHIVDTDILQGGEIQGSCLKVKDLRVKLVILPPVEVVEEPLREWLDGFKASGGHVIECSGEVDKESFLASVSAVVKPSLSIQSDGEEVSFVYASKRVINGRSLWFVLNTGARAVDVQLVAGERLREIPLDESVPLGLEEKDGHYTRVIQPFESFLLEAAGPAEVAAEKGWPEERPKDRLRDGSHDRPVVIDIHVRDEAELRLGSKNLLRMYDWTMSLFDEAGNPIQTAEVPALPLSDQLERGGFRFAPKNNKFFGSVPELSLPEMRVRYEYRFMNRYQGPVELVMEPGSIRGDWKLYINDSGEVSHERFALTSTHIRGSLGADITRLLRQGENLIRIEVSTAKPNDGLLNPLYLAGGFGVSLDPVALVQPRTCGLFEDYEANLIPYYAGMVEYASEFELKNLPDAEYVYLRFDYGKRLDEATEVSVNDSEFQAVLWQPRCIRLRPSQLRRGKNRLVTRVYTSLIRSFEGMWFDYNRHAYREVGDVDR